jgi:hypothetical protein
VLKRPGPGVYVGLNEWWEKQSREQTYLSLTGSGLAAESCLALERANSKTAMASISAAGAPIAP